MQKKAYYYSIDALIAIIIIFSILVTVKTINKQEPFEVHTQEDVIEVLSSLSMSDFNSSYSQFLIAQGLASPNKTLIDQITEFYAKEMPEALLLAENALLFLNSTSNIGLWFSNELVSSINSSSIDSAENIWVAREMISGVEKGQNVKGYSARAFLQKSSQIKYDYFGGYVGDGNITLNISYFGELRDVFLEIAINKDFDIYINNQYSGHYEKSPSDIYPAKYSLASYLPRFSSGENIIKIAGAKLYIAGGFLKIAYDSNRLDYETKVQIPGIQGTINLYDGINIPDSLSAMEIFIHYFSNHSTFMTIGNTTIFNETLPVEQQKLIADSELKSKLNYASIMGKTLPFRLGLAEISGIAGGNADVVIITDLSDSMNSRMDSDNSGTVRNCTNTLLYSNSTSRISIAKCLDNMLVEMILNVSGNRVALSAFYGDDSSPFKGRVYQESLTSNAIYLKSKINIYNPQGGTCICCAENNAYKILNEQSSSDRKKFVIVMSDGIPTHTCQAASGCTGTRTGLQSDEGLWLGYGAGCYGGLDDCNVNDCECASQNANWSACRLKTLNSSVYSIGFGPVSSCSMANKTLSNIADCGQGKYYSSQDPEALRQIYYNIGNEIASLSYTYQISNVSSGFSQSVLYPDSYIKFSYPQDLTPYGLTISSESGNFNSESSGTFLVPEHSTILDAYALSYSGFKWTYNLRINGNNFYNLSDYGLQYPTLGDPYVVKIPNEKILNGTNNVTIKTISSNNISFGSEHNKVIYRVVKPFIGYSNILPSASGCSWSIETESGQIINANIPLNYTGTSKCYFQANLSSYNENDAISSAVNSLLKNVDFNNNRKIDVYLQENDLQITTSEISGIPYAYNSEVQVRVWR